MKRILIGVGCLGLAALWLWRGLDREAAPARGLAPTGHETAAVEPSAEPDDVAPVAAEEAPPEEERESLEALPEVANSEPESTLFGRIVDPTGNGIAGVALELSSYQASWSGEDEVPLLHDYGRWQRYGYETVSDDSGGFSFEFATPRPELELGLSKQGSLFLDLMRIEFGGTGRSNRPPVRPGDNDLGDLVLQRAGTISGRVLDPDTQPIVGAQVHIEDSFPGGYGRATETTDDGTFTIEQIPEGTYAVAVVADGFLMTTETSLEVRAGEDRGGVELRPARAPSVSGTVVDQAGEPVEGVRVWGWPVGSGRGAGAMSGADGRFRVFLAQDEPHVFEVRAKGFKFWGGHGSGEVHRQGEENVEIVLERIGETTFLVVDDESGAPLERFGLSIGMQVSLAVEEHPGGRTTRVAEPGSAGFCVLAPGYAPRSGAIVYDEDGVPLQTVRMSPGATIVGRLLSGDEPCRHPTVGLERAHHKLDPSAPDLDEHDALFSDDYGYDLDHFEGRERIVTGAEDGTFRVEDLAPGTYTLRLEPAAGAPLTLEPVRVEAGEVHDVGDAVLRAPARISGTIVLGNASPRGGFTVELAGMSARLSTTTDLDGRFEFDDLAPGLYALQVEEKPGVLTRSDRHELRLDEGEHEVLTLDLSAHVPCRLSVAVSVSGTPGAGLKLVFLEPGREHGQGLGTTDERGELEYVGAAPGAGRVVVNSAAGFRIGATEPLELGAGDTASVELDCNAGTLDLQLPGPPTLGEGLIRLEVTEQETGVVQRPFPVFVTGGVPANSPLDWSAARVPLGAIAPGEYRVRLSIDGQAPLVGSASVEAAGQAVCELAEK